MANKLFILGRQLGLKRSLNNLIRSIFTNELKPCSKALIPIALNQSIFPNAITTFKLPPIILEKKIEVEWKNNLKKSINEKFVYIEFPNLGGSLNSFHYQTVEPGKCIDLPAKEEFVEKYAHRMINIRRRKMKKHKRKKLIKKMKHEWRKKRLRRKLQREKAFRTEMAVYIRKAEKFNAERYLLSRLEILSRKKPDIIWRGELLPEATVKDFKEKRDKKKEFRLNRPRLNLN
ncbi:uncharacterized protein [Prorops nasuta]|uniref:uncharacterized protein n=1 Tax=Prorops nasuta TaxID=863751 RepID=UPI0034CF01FB